MRPCAICGENHAKHPIDWKKYQAAMIRTTYREFFEFLAKPLKFPARRRRSDREIPKAA